MKHAKTFVAKIATDLTNDKGTGQVDKMQRNAYLNSKGIKPNSLCQLDLFEKKAVSLGEPFEFSVKNLVRDVNWSKSGRNYNRVRECISRLKANEVLALNNKAYGKSGAISLIQKYEVINDADGRPTQYRVWINPNLILLFAGNTFTSHNWEVYRDLSPVARRLADYIESHKHPFPLSLEKFRQMCGSIDAKTFSWRQTVRKACSEVQTAGIADTAFLAKDDKICCVCEH